MKNRSTMHKIMYVTLVLLGMFCLYLSVDSFTKNVSNETIFWAIFGFACLIYAEVKDISERIKI